MTISDVNDLDLYNIQIGSHFFVSSGGDVIDPQGSNINVVGDGTFTANSVTLGDSATDVVNFNRIKGTVTDQMEINEDSTVILLDVSAQDLTVRTPHGIYDGNATTISVVGNATFEGKSHVQVGDNGTDTFNAGSVTVRSLGHVSLFENSSMMIVGENNATSMHLFSSESIEDADLLQST